MRRHLDEGCENCERVVRSLRRVDGDDERSGLHRAASERLAADREMMDLVWDSARAPWLGGADGEDEGRQLHFAHSEYELNARVANGAAGRTTLSGRLQSRFQVGVGNLPVRLVSRRRVLDSSSTGDLGEFELPVELDEAVELQIALADDRELIATIGDE